MAYLGRYQQGDTIAIRFSTLDSSGTLAAPTEQVRFKVYGPAGTAVAASYCTRIGTATSGTFGINLRLGSAYATAGRYIFWAEANMGSGLYRYFIMVFRIVAGGDDSGHVHSLFSWSRPEASYLVGGDEDGEIWQGRNPVVD